MYNIHQPSTFPCLRASLSTFLVLGKNIVQQPITDEFLSTSFDTFFVEVLQVGLALVVFSQVALEDKA